MHCNKCTTRLRSNSVKNPLPLLHQLGDVFLVDHARWRSDVVLRQMLQHVLSDTPSPMDLPGLTMTAMGLHGSYQNHKVYGVEERKQKTTSYL
eukprot:5977274-Amphidinium_carterae.1